MSQNEWIPTIQVQWYALRGVCFCIYTQTHYKVRFQQAVWCEIASHTEVKQERHKLAPRAFLERETPDSLPSQHRWKKQRIPLQWKKWHLKSTPRTIIKWGGEGRWWNQEKAGLSQGLVVTFPKPQTHSYIHFLTDATSRRLLPSQHGCTLHTQGCPSLS